MRLSNLFKKIAKGFKSNRFTIQQGGTSCFDGNQKVVTDKGAKSIKDLSLGDKVLSYNEEKDINEFNLVVNTMRFDNIKKTIKVKLKNGKTITATEDHKFYYEGGWISLKHLLSLWDGRNLEEDTRV